jgi:hypothetical protein
MQCCAHWRSRIVKCLPGTCEAQQPLGSTLPHSFLCGTRLESLVQLMSVAWLWPFEACGLRIGFESHSRSVTSPWLAPLPPPSLPRGCRCLCATAHQSTLISSIFHQLFGTWTACQVTQFSSRVPWIFHADLKSLAHYKQAEFMFGYDFVVPGRLRCAAV